jgi:ABC-2 type transport system ATP-binding protein
VRELSRGDVAKVALTIALAPRPRLLLLDEPTSGLDPEMAIGVRELLGRLRDEGRAVLVSTHNLDEAERVADRVAVLRECLIAIETPGRLRQRFAGRLVRIDLVEKAECFARAALEAGAEAVSVDGNALLCRVGTPERVTPNLVRRLVEAGAAIRTVTEEQAGLEEIYLALVRGDRPASTPGAGRHGASS